MAEKDYIDLQIRN